MSQNFDAVIAAAKTLVTAEFEGTLFQFDGATPDVQAGLTALPEPAGAPARRTLFQAACDARGSTALVVSEATSAFGGDGKYALRIWWWDQRFRAVESVCTACAATGRDARGFGCIECDAQGWDFWFGSPIAAGPIVEIANLSAPSCRLYKPAWRGKPGSAPPVGDRGIT